jgi:aldose 1-epimerase
MPSTVVIENDQWRVGLVPESGGSVVFGQVRMGDTWVDVLRPTPEEDLGTAPATASYPLVPWSNRIRDGKLKWQGKTYQLRRNFADGTAIHGTGTEYPWTIVEQQADRIVLEFSSRDVYGVNFPWTFSARFTYALEGNRFTWTLAVTNTDHETFPAGLGHHPHFVRNLTAGDGASLGDEVQLQINCEKGYDLVDCMPSAGAGDVPAHADFRQMRPLGTEFVDDCLTARTSPITVTVDYPGALTVDIEADDLFEHVVVYIPQGEDFFAVEPVTNANDGFSLDDAGIPGTGLFLVQPGQTRSADFTMVANVH